jgi:hypothetical protein
LWGQHIPVASWDYHSAGSRVFSLSPRERVGVRAILSAALSQRTTDGSSSRNRRVITE